MNSDFELLNCVADRRTFGAAWLTVFSHVIFLAALISVEELFTIAYTRGTNVFLYRIDHLLVYFDSNIM